MAITFPVLVSVLVSVLTLCDFSVDFSQICCLWSNTYSLSLVHEDVCN